MGYRSIKELNNWKKIDFLKKLKKELKNKSKNLNKLEKNIIKKVKKAFLKAEKSKFPKYSDLLTGVYE